MLHYGNSLTAGIWIRWLWPAAAAIQHWWNFLWPISGLLAATADHHSIFAGTKARIATTTFSTGAVALSASVGQQISYLSAKWLIIHPKLFIGFC